MSFRVGIGYDAHPLVPGRPLVLGGVTVPSDLGLGGHSDADVLSHAVVDAVLGAAGLGDIGVHFPESDPRWAGAPSLAFVTQAAAMAREGGLAVASLDATVVLEAPRLAPHLGEMAVNLAASLEAKPSVCSVKATTTDGLGFIGRGEGAAALAVVLLREMA